MPEDKKDLRPNRHKELIYCTNCKCSRRAPCTCAKNSSKRRESNDLGGKK